MKKATLLVTVWIFAGFLALLYETPAQAAPIWGSDASLELTGSRTSPAASGVDATCQWDNGGFEIEWDISQVADGSWNYIYMFDVTDSPDQIKNISHFILEVTDDDSDFNIYDGTSTPIEGPQEWDVNTPGNSNPLMPNSFYGVKFDFGSDPDGTVTYVFNTDRAPVYGLFYAKDGANKVDTVSYDVVAWSNALNSSDYKTSDFLTVDGVKTLLTTNDFIIRPDGVPVPEPSTILLLGTSLLGMIGFSRKRLNKKA